MKYFETKFLKEADLFVSNLDKKTAKKLIYIIELAEKMNDPKLFKKLHGEIWEFRCKFLGNHNRLLAFWDKSEKHMTLVIATHGFIKKSNKVPLNEINKAEQIRQQYFKAKENEK